MHINENTTVEQPTIELLKSIGYEYIDGRSEDIHDSILGRETTKDVLLAKRLKKSLIKLNPAHHESIIDEAIKELKEIGLNKDINKANMDIYDKLKNGIKLKITNTKGKQEFVKINFFDFENPTNNDFLAVNQMTIQGDFYTRYPDVLIFVNGIPLTVIEFKKPTVNVYDAYNDNLRDYKDTIPELFWYNCVTILSNGTQTKVGAFNSPWTFFKDWKRIESEEEKGDTLIENTIKGTLNQTRLLDIFENFVLYEQQAGKIIKIVAQNHQYLGVNRAFESVENRKELDGKLGVFWHTQGSGKSFSMVFLASKVMRRLNGNFTFLVLTDRGELDKQIYTTFTQTGINNEKKVRAESIKDLRKLLDEDHRFVFTLIHKFQEKELDIHPTLTEREDVIVMVDEAHRSQYDQLALNMRNALPNANFMAFTGTPLLSGDRVTEDIFGKYVSTYNFQRAVEDSATIPIFYENRVPKLKLDNQDIGEDIAEIHEKYELDDDESERFAKEYSTQYQLITRDDRMDKIAEDIVNHYFYQTGDWKAMVVCIDKKTTVRLYDKVNKEVKKLKIILENHIKQANSTMELNEIKGVLEKVENFDSAVVVSFGSTQNEEIMKKEYGVDMKPHRKRMLDQNLEKEFKKDNNLKMVFVCNMRLTGFDAPKVRTLYLDKPMKGHTLMQTIARVNRVFEGKENGLIVDYLGLFKNLQKALADYASTGEGDVDYPAQDKEELVKIIALGIKECQKFIKTNCKIERKELKESEGFDQLKVLKKISDRLLSSELKKKEWKSLSSKLLGLYKSLLPDFRANEFSGEINLIKAVVLYIQNIVDTKTDVSEIKKEMESLLDSSISVDDFEIEKTGLIRNLAELDGNKLREIFKSDDKNIQLKRTESLLKDRIADMIKKNPLSSEFKKKLDELMDKYNNNSIDIEETFQLLIELSKDLDEEETAQLESMLTQEEYVIFKKIYKNGLKPKEEKEIKNIAHSLYEKILSVKNKYVDWKNKTQGRALMYITIKDTLFETVPVPTYTQDDAETKSKEVYNYTFEYL